MRDVIWILGSLFLMALAALLYAPWWSIYDWVRKQTWQEVQIT